MVARRFLNGKMDLETTPYQLANGDYPYALNISSTSTDGSFKPMIGNRVVSYTMPDGTNKVIGFKDDVIRDRCFYFVWNSNGNHSILIFNKTARTVQKLLEDITDTGNLSILNFDLNRKITGIDILYRDSDEGDILSWTDGVTSPKEAIIDKLLNGDYGVVLEEYIEAGKRPPLNSPVVDYINDNSRNVNSLRRKLFQFKFRWVYDDFSKSTWSPVSKCPLPNGLFADPDLDSDPGYNNAIDISINTGNIKVTRIEIAGRVSLGNVWSDFFLVDSVSKSDLLLSDGSVYVYRFFNDAVYPYVDVNESNLLFDWMPRLAKAQGLANGNVKVYGNITEGYNRVTDLSISVESELRVNDSGVFNGPPTMVWDTSSFFGGNNDGLLIFEGTPIVGTRYLVLWRESQYVGPTIFMDYTSVLGDTNNSIAAAMAAQRPSDVSIVVNNQITIILSSGDVTASIYYTQVYASTSGAGSSNGYEGTWNWWSRYLIGIVYFDEQGRTNGVHLDKTVGRANSDVSTQPYQLTSNVGMTPALTVSINHNPPSWAKSYQIVRSRNLSIGDFLFWKTDAIDNTDAEYYYFSIQSLFDRREKQESYVPNWDFVEGDRMRVVINNIGGTQTIPGTDYLVVGIEEVDRGSGLKKYVKVKKPENSPPTYTGSMLLQLWRPAITGGSPENEVFYEFGQVFGIYEDNGVLYHRGGSQDQTDLQPAEIFLQEGDIYYRKRTFVANDSLYITDANYSDDFRSAVNSNGRPQVIDYNAKETVFQTLVRFGGTYESGTSINGINRFYFDDLDEYDRQFGAIQRLRMVDRYMRVFQELKCGRVPVYQQVIKDAVGGDILAQSNKLLNNIQYYQGEFGCGRHPEAIASNNFSDYFVDTNRGVVCRLSMDGLTPLSIIYNANNFFVQNLTAHGDADFVYGVFDASENRYIITMTVGGADKTIAFSEQKKGFESFHSFEPEYYGCIGTLLLMFKDGQVWTNDSTVYCNWFGVQYKPKFSVLFNDMPMIKKTFQAVSYIAGDKWFVPVLGTSVDQDSRVPESYFKKREDVYHAPLLRDVDSRGGLLGGSMLKGNWINITFEKINGATGEEFQYAEVKHSISNLNAQ